MFQSGCADHAIDVVLVTEHQYRLDLALIHGTVFKVQPDPIVPLVCRVTDVKRQIVSQSANAGETTATKLLKYLAFSDDSAP